MERFDNIGWFVAAAVTYRCCQSAASTGSRLDFGHSLSRPDIFRHVLAKLSLSVRPSKNLAAHLRLAFDLLTSIFLVLHVEIFALGFFMQLERIALGGRKPASQSHEETQGEYLD